MNRFKVRWIDRFHAADDFELIRGGMEAADDEGPILLAPVLNGSGPARRASSGYPAQLFENPLCLEAHLSMYGSEINCEFWVGICDHQTREMLELAVSGLWHLKELLNELGKVASRRRLPKRPNKGAAEFASMTEYTLRESPLSAFNVLIDNEGEAFVEVAKTYDLTPTLLISRS